jgi:hypothetical protein
VSLFKNTDPQHVMTLRVNDVVDEQNVPLAFECLPGDTVEVPDKFDAFVLSLCPAFAKVERVAAPVAAASADKPAKK